MPFKVMIIDGQADFRTLLTHHVTSHWPDAVITAYDPIEAGYLPDEFSGAGSDVVLLGDHYGERNALLYDLERALERLDPDERALLAMRYVAGFDSNELAAAIGLSPSGTRTRLERLLARLRKELE